MTPGRQYSALALSLALGLAAGVLLAEFAAAWPLAGLLCVFAIAFGYGYDLPGWGYVATALLGLGLGLAAEGDRQSVLDRAALDSRPFVCEVEVGGEPELVEAKSGRRWVGFPARLGAVTLKVVVPVDDGDPPRPGEVWRVAGWLDRREVSDRSRRRLWVGSRGTSAARLSAAPRWRLVLGAVRENFARRLAIGLDHSPASVDLMRALLLGERRRLTPRMRRVFADSGTMHIFAISGLHVGVVGSALMFFVALFLMPRRWAGLVVLPPVWAYVAMIGAPPSAVRAAAMMSLALAASCCWRKADLIVVWSQVFIVMHVVSPWLIAEPGSVLSFAVMLAILVWAQVVGRGVTVAAWAAGVPVVARVFGVVTPIGLIVNLVLLPAATLAVWSGILGILVSFVSGKLAAYVNNLTALVIDVMTAFAEVASRLPFGNFEVERWTVWMGALWYLALALSMWLLVRRRARRNLI